MKDESRAWLLALQECVSAKIESVPAGWMTMEQIAKIFGKSQAQSFKDVRMLAGSNKAEKRMFRIQAGKRILRIPHYKLK